MEKILTLSMGPESWFTFEKGLKQMLSCYVFIFLFFITILLYSFYDLELIGLVEQCW